jgi:predicted site-specific integrase-resolvase
MLGLHERTLVRHRKEGRLVTVRTPGGHHRFLRAQAGALLRGETPEESCRLAVEQLAALRAETAAAGRFWMSSGEVGALLRATTQAVGRWAADGLVPFFQTPAGRRCFRREVVAELLCWAPPEDAEEAP